MTNDKRGRYIVVTRIKDPTELREKEEAKRKAELVILFN